MGKVKKDAVLSILRAELGYKESPAGSNRTKYGVWYGLNGFAWCVMFQMWAFAQAGALDMVPKKTASCSELMRAAKAAGQWVTGEYRSGDLVIFDFPNTKYKTDHCGMIWAVLDGGRYMVIEGNTGVTSDSNGGEVMARIREESVILGAWRPDWEEVEAVPLDNNIPDSYALEAVEWAKVNGILQGDAHGNLNLHQPCSRQHVLVWLWRLAKLLGKA